MQALVAPLAAHFDKNFRDLVEIFQELKLSIEVIAPRALQLHVFADACRGPGARGLGGDGSGVE